MRKLVLLSIAAFSLNGMAIELITEAQVGQSLAAQKVIEVSKHAVETLVEGTVCAQDFASRSARAYVVKQGNEASLYLTPSGLTGLNVCRKL